jgi:hypothetical protein
MLKWELKQILSATRKSRSALHPNTKQAYNWKRLEENLQERISLSPQQSTQKLNNIWSFMHILGLTVLATVHSYSLGCYVTARRVATFDSYVNFLIFKFSKL